MRPSDKPEGAGSHDLWKVKEAAAFLQGQACTLAARHISDGMQRLRFNQEIAYFSQRIIRDFEAGKRSHQNSIRMIEEEKDSLLNQTIAVGKKVGGLVAGGLQIYSGSAVCLASLGTLCLIYGLPQIAHGGNNVYENGRNLIQNRSDTQGPVRKLYQNIAIQAGGSEFEGNIAYGSIDILMSAYGIWGLALKPDARRLFRYVDSDKARGYTLTPKRIFYPERAGDFITIESMLNEWKAHNE